MPRMSDVTITRGRSCDMAANTVLPLESLHAPSPGNASVVVVMTAVSKVTVTITGLHVVDSLPVYNLQIHNAFDRISDEAKFFQNNVVYI